MADITQDQFPQVIDTDHTTFWMNCQIDNTGDQQRVLAKDTPFVISTDAGIWQWDSNTADADPGSGEFRMNNTNGALATFVYISNNDQMGQDVGDDLLTLSAGDRFNIVESNNRGYEFELTGTPIDGGSYVKLPVSNTIDLGTTFSNNARCQIKGSQPSIASIASSITSLSGATYGWAKYVDTNHSVSNKLELRNTNNYMAQITNNGLSPLGSTSQWAVGVAHPWDTATNKIVGAHEGDLIDFQLEFIANGGNQDRKFDLTLDVGGVQGIVYAETKMLASGNSVDTYVSLTGVLEVSADLLANGGIFQIESDGDMDLWDVRMRFVRSYRGK